ncbi:hypothetical protein I8751_13615 [Nostocaceae cyanobacterium CENA357]|uniref:Uncharacterized protein n=1 Tax=Atlanticothrix silvestris CENA357 TaxID=1725252 RepID=A0A8J7HEL0_9CYAN|nr:hypothetical protein [Atlanticothrix silvestris]MBH8553393.1 hypothetical protein [Atlanticothrix silvestris CENA357]
MWYTFLRQPPILVKRFDHPPSELLKSLLKWHQQVSTTLGVEILKDMTAEAYFAEERRKRMQQRQSLIRKSIIWGLLEMLWFSQNPKSEWLGEHAKFKVSK